MFSLARVVKDNKSINHLVPLLNSDLGRLYQIIGDMSSLHTLLERPSKPVAEIRFQLDEMKARFGNLYQMKDFLAKEHDIIGVVEALLKQPDVSKLKSGIYALITRLQNILNTETLRAVRGGS
jgi:chromosome segregation ATPase